jgi:hypothetical protein
MRIVFGGGGRYKDRTGTDVAVMSFSIGGAGREKPSAGLSLKSNT